MKYNTINLVDAYMAKTSPELKPLADAVRRIICKSVLHLEESLRWNQPCYFFYGPVCAFSVQQKSVDVSFFRGDELEAPAGLLQFSAKNLPHLKITSLDELDEIILTDLVKQAVNLNKNEAGVPVIAAVPA